MKARRVKARLIALALLAMAAGPVAAQEFAIGERLKQGRAAPAARGDARELTWENLVPADWKPDAKLSALKLEQLSDGDPRAVEALEAMRAEFDKAPVVQALDGARVKIPGFVVMLAGGRQGVTEFLLVPYFGACIHVPPPPANQIVHVKPDRPVPEKVAMAPVWVTGTLRTTRWTTEYGAAGYQIDAARVEPYPWQEQQRRR